MVTRCYLCGGRTEHRQVTAENWWGDTLALVENVPAWVCQQCGEAYFEADTSRRLDHLRQAQSLVTRTVTVPVYRFEAVA